MTFFSVETVVNHSNCEEEGDKLTKVIRENNSTHMKEEWDNMNNNDNK